MTGTPGRDTPKSEASNPPVRAAVAANSLVLSGDLVGREALRFTPAGIAVLSATISHRSIQREAGHERELAFEMSLRCADRVARQFESIALGESLEVSGFLAPRRRNSPVLVMHVQEFRKVTN